MAPRAGLLRLVLGAFAGILLAPESHGQAIDEYRVKAAFLYNFAKFVEWPPGSLKGAPEPISICLLGKNPFGDALAEAVNGKTLENRPFAIRQLADIREAAGCQILFVSSSERKRFGMILSGVRAVSVLTVGEADTFTSEGGIVNFKIVDGSVRIQINPEAATEAKLHISSKLLSLAQLVGR